MNETKFCVIVSTHSFFSSHREKLFEQLGLINKLTVIGGALTADENNTKIQKIGVEFSRSKISLLRFIRNLREMRAHLTKLKSDHHHFVGVYQIMIAIVSGMTFLHMKNKSYCFSGFGLIFVDPKYVYLRILFVFLLKVEAYFIRDIKYVVQNSDDEKIITRILPSIRHSNIWMIPGCGIIDKNIRKHYRVRSKEEPFKIGFLGRIIQTKGIFELVELARKCSEFKNIQFVIGGNFDRQSPNAIREQDFLKLLPGNCHFVGVVDNWADFWDSVDCCISLSYREGIPQSVLEAMARGCPVILSRVTGHSQLTDGPCRPGFGVSLGEIETEGVAALRQICLEPTLYQLMSTNAIFRVKNDHSLTRIVAQYKTMFGHEK